MGSRRRDTSARVKLPGRKQAVEWVLLTQVGGSACTLAGITVYVMARRHEGRAYNMGDAMCASTRLYECVLSATEPTRMYVYACV